MSRRHAWHLVRQNLGGSSNIGTASAHFVSTPEQKCIGGPEPRYISDAGKKAPELGAVSVRHQACVGLSAAVSEAAGRERRLL